MFEKWGHVMYRFRHLVLVATVGFLAFAGLWGTGVFANLAAGGFEDPSSESTAAVERIDETVGRQAADVVVLYESDRLTVDDPDFEAGVREVVEGLPSEVTRVVSYLDSPAPNLVSDDRHATTLVLTLEDGEGDFEAVADELEAPGLETSIGGGAAIFDEVNTQVEHDIVRAEMISMPIVLLLSLIIFGSVVSGLMPFLMGSIAILGAFTMLHVLSLFTDVSVFAINIITILGLGMAIDYALFIVSRFREEIQRTASVEEAVVRTVATAGRTVAFSGLIIAASMASLLIFPQNFLQSMGFGGMAAVLIAMLAGLSTLPALLGTLGHRINALRLPYFGRAKGAEAEADGHGAWAAIARSVMRRPVVYAGVIVVVLLALGSPFLRVTFGSVDERVLPEDAESRVVAERLAAEFPGGDVDGADVVVRGGSAGEVRQYADRLAAVDGVDQVREVVRTDGTTLLEAQYAVDPQSEEARSLVADVRDVPAPDGVTTLVGGETAEALDLLDSLADRLPWMALIVIGVMLVLLFAAFGSVVLPIKAVLMTAVSIAASFGVVVLVFQDGNLSDVLDFTSTGYIEATQPILMLAILFGLSMDYEVFLLSRIREHWDRSHDNTESVAVGVQRTGRIITSLALLLIVVIGGFSTSGITFIKMIGVGMIVAIFVDATVIRTLLVPATMRLLGRANWWAPRPLRRVWERYGFREEAA
ncbi:MAG: MMPL family transporter [Propionibacteriales bacterium]|nr:MMPL family transporter [Propionibacteriales bacterium]